ncbi:MAG TPA: AMP-binding protein, partial [Steroidobacter sp.]|nr:AMP-binding protein [Steroidobacter sp.]
MNAIAQGAPMTAESTKPWLKSYPEGVPEQINPEEYTSAVELIDGACARFAEKPAFTSMGRTITYADYERLSRDFAAYLQNIAQLKKGDRIALMMPNVLQYPIALYGALRAGLTVVNTNPMYTARELEHQLTDSGAKAIVILENFAHTLEHVLAKTEIQHVIITGAGDQLHFPKSLLTNLVLRYVRKQVPSYNLPNAVPFNKALQRGRYEMFKPVSMGHDDIAFLQYTGGTTGVAKGAMLTHRNIVSNVLQAESWIGTAARVGQDTIITAL